MSADLAARHLETLNMRFDGGRAESAPTLNSVESVVQGWYDTPEENVSNGDTRMTQRIRRKVSFNNRVSIRGIPATGRMRAVVSRSMKTHYPKTTVFEKDEVDGQEEIPAMAVDETKEKRGSCECAGPLGGQRWADADDILCNGCAGSWRALASSRSRCFPGPRLPTEGTGSGDGRVKPAVPLDTTAERSANKVESECEHLYPDV